MNRSLRYRHEWQKLYQVLIYKRHCRRYYGLSTSVFLTTAPSGPRSPHCRGFKITHRHITLGRTPLDEWSAGRRDTWQHTTLTTDRHPCPWRDSKSRSQQASGGTPTPYNTQPLRSANKWQTETNVTWLEWVIWWRYIMDAYKYEFKLENGGVR